MNLKDKAEKLLHDAREIVKKADAEARAMTADEMTAYEAQMADFDATQATIRAQARIEAAAAAVPAQAARQAIETATPADAEAYRAAFLASMRDGMARPELRVQTLSDAAGGYAVPDVWRSQIIQALELENPIRPIATVFTTTTGTLHLPVVSAHGSAAWTAEEAAFNDASETFTEATLSAYKETAIVKVSEELLNDINFPLESYLSAEFGKKFGRLEEAAFVAGDGSSKPTGVSETAGLGKTATATNAITAGELVDLFYSLGRVYRNRATFLMNDSTVKAIRNLQTGVSGDNTFLWAPGLRAGEPDTLLGRPVVTSSSVAAIASAAKVIYFGDFSYYFIGERQAIGMQRLNELYSATGHVGFRQFRRVDGKLVLAEAMKHLLMA